VYVQPGRVANPGVSRHPRRSAASARYNDDGAGPEGPTPSQEAQ